MEIVIKKKKIVTISGGKIRKFPIAKGMQITSVYDNEVDFSIKKGKKSIEGSMVFGECGKLMSVECVVTKGKKQLKIGISK